MDKKLENLINPPWLKSLQRLQNQGGLNPLLYQESEALRSIRKLSESNRLASLALGQSQLMKSVQKIAESSKLASLAFRESAAMRSIRELTQSNRFAALALQETRAIKSLRAAAESAQLSTMAFRQSEVVKQLQSIAGTSQLASIALKQSDAFKQISQFRNLEIFKALANLNNSPFTGVSSIDFVQQVSVDQVVDESLLEIDSRLSDEVTSNTDFNQLSEKTKSILIYLYHYYFLPVLLSCLSAYLMANAVEARKELKSVTTHNGVKTFIRSSHSSFDQSALKGFRVTIVDSLNFREGPSMRAEVISTLPIGTLVEIVDKSRRSWLLVEVEVNGELEQGWISRRYTTYFK